MLTVAAVMFAGLLPLMPGVDSTVAAAGLSPGQEALAQAEASGERVEMTGGRRYSIVFANPDGDTLMQGSSKFSDDVFVRFIFAPMILLIGTLFLGNYKRFIERFHGMRREAIPMPVSVMVIIFRTGGAVQVIFALTLLVGLW